MNRVLGSTKDNVWGVLLDTGYREFQSPSGIQGLYKESPTRLDLLAVAATEPGTGQFRRFIAACKGRYDTICVWEIMNPELNGILKRYGFETTTEQENGETLDGWKWEAST